MVHLGEAKYFKAVYEDAFAQAVVLVEGIRSPITRRITRTYRWIEGASQFGLVVQPSYPRADGCRARIINADLSEADFLKVWRDVPAWLRAVSYLVAPVVGISYRLFGTRQALARGMSLEDLPRREETLSWNPETAPLTNAVLHARDQRLVSVLAGQLDHPVPGTDRIAVVFGALHMRAVLRLLSLRGYRPKDRKWLTVFPIWSTSSQRSNPTQSENLGWHDEYAVMNKEEASRFNVHGISAIRELTSALNGLQGSCGDEEALVIKRSIADIIARIDTLLVEAVYAKFPDLDDLASRNR
jgi:hypothetical protein